MKKIWKGLPVSAQSITETLYWKRDQVAEFHPGEADTCRCLVQLNMLKVRITMGITKSPKKH